MESTVTKRCGVATLSLAAALTTATGAEPSRKGLVLWLDAADPATFELDAGAAPAFGATSLLQGTTRRL